MSDVAFPKLTLAEKIFKDLVWDPAVEAALTALYANPATSWMATWPVKPFVEYIVKHFSGWLFAGVTLFVDVTAIRMVNREAQQSYDISSISLQKIATQTGEDSPEFKEARERAKKDLSRFGRFGATLP